MKGKIKDFVMFTAYTPKRKSGIPFTSNSNDIHDLESLRNKTEAKSAFPCRAWAMKCMSGPACHWGSFGKAPVSSEGSPTRYPVHYAMKPAASGQATASRKGAGRAIIWALLPTCFSQKYSSMRRLCFPKSNHLLGFQKSIKNLAFLLFHRTEGSSC